MKKHAWGCAVIAFVLVELFLRSRRSETLSCYTRSRFRTDTRKGKIAFLLGYLGFSAWYVPHIIRNRHEIS